MASTFSGGSRHLVPPSSELLNETKGREEMEREKPMALDYPSPFGDGQHCMLVSVVRLNPSEIETTVPFRYFRASGFWTPRSLPVFPAVNYCSATPPAAEFSVLSENPCLADWPTGSLSL